MRLSNFPKYAFLLSSLLFVSVHGGRKHHKSASASQHSQPSGVSTPIVESDHVPSATSQITQASAPMAQSRSASLASERISSPSNGGYSQPIYSSPYDPAMMSESSIPEQTYYDPMVSTPQHHHHHPHAHHHTQQQQQQQAVAASGHYHHHTPAAPVQARSAPISSATQYQAAASSVAPYAAAAPYGHPHQQYYAGYAGYDQYGGRYAAQGSAHHDAYGVKRGHGYGGYGWHPDLEIQTLFFIGIPLIIIPLLFLWPYFLYSLHYRGGHHGYGGYRASDGTAEVVSTPEKELKKKTDELTKKVVPKLSKKSDKSSKSSSDKSSSSS